MRRHKLRYRETHAKKLFLEMLRNGVSVTHDDNAKLRDENMKHKAELKAVKGELRGEYERISASSAEVGKKAKIIQAQLDQGTELIKKIQDMRWELNVIRSSTTADKRLTPDQISDRLADNDDRLLELDDQEKQLTDQLESMRAEIARIKARMEKLAVDRPRAAAQALKLHQMDLNERAEIAQLVNTRRQLIEFNKRLMAVQSVTAPSENELRIAFEAERPPSAAAQSPPEVITLSLVFNPANRRLAAAQLIGSDVNIDELRLVAIETNDIPAFVRDVRRRLTGMMNLEHEGLA
ncbi:hypothetical protein DL93DRAFT_2076917 [Clavulina sp. PMI_390]|nr:hypothetical protein DL93DRAFT_2076917 [Clavulina sp. PMI_390]